MTIAIYRPQSMGYLVMLRWSWAQRRHNMGNIASNETSSPKNVENTSENGGPAMSPILKPYEPQLGPSWSQVAPSWNKVGPSWNQVGPKLGRSWGLSGGIWPQVGPMLRPCWIETAHLVLGRSAKCANYRSPVHFLPACPRRNAPPFNAVPV